METRKLTFKEQYLLVDYITFSIPYSNFDEKGFANYFSKFKFNSKKVTRRGEKVTPSYPILVNKKNEFEVLFVHAIEYSDIVTLHFSGPNASRFYFFIQNGLIDWKIFDNIKLTRFDLCFLQKIRFSEKSILSFFHECQQYISPTLSSKIEKNSDGPILKVGSRRSQQNYRIYHRNGHLRFEYEIRKESIKQHTSLLLENKIELFESTLTKQYILYSGKIIPLKSKLTKYTSWLIPKLRYFRQMSPKSFIFQTDYIQSQQIKTFQDEKNIILFFQFLSYIRKLDYQTEHLGNTSYRCVYFEIRDFLKAQNQKYTYYQLKKLKDFIENLQTNFIIQKFSDSYFQSLASVPKVEFFKSQKTLGAKVWIAEELFFYQYPFSFPELQTEKFLKYEFSVLSHILITFSSISLDKHFDLTKFLDSYSTLSNKDTKLIKEYFIKYIRIFVDNNIIENRILITQNKHYYSVSELTTKNISDGFILYEILDY